MSIRERIKGIIRGKSDNENVWKGVRRISWEPKHKELHFYYIRHGSILAFRDSPLTNIEYVSVDENCDAVVDRLTTDEQVLYFNETSALKVKEQGKVIIQPEEWM